MTLSVAILVHMNKIAVCHAIDAHVHDRFIAHADLHTAVAASPVAVLATARVLALTTTNFPRLPHTVLVIVVVGLAARALWAQMLIKTD